MTVPCTDAALQRGDAMTATASRAARWLLVEHPGPWGPPSLPTGRMPLELSRALAAAAAAAGARLMLLRRPGRPPAGDDTRRVFLVDAQIGSQRLLRATVGSDEAMVALVGQELPFPGAPVSATEVTGAEQPWQRVAEPLLLVCTHGRHDRCCAVRGRPVAQELASIWPGRTWECSHTGGDRFAANLLLMPQGLYFGQLSPAQAVDVVRACDDGRVPVAHLRGRSSSTLPAQAAEHFARTETGRDRATDLVPDGQQDAGPDRWRVRLRGDAGPDVEVDVRYDRAGTPALLTCGALEPKVAPVFRCELIRELAPQS